jgi:hypothetical protein
MPGFMPGIHAFAHRQGVDGRDKPGHDDTEEGAIEHGRRYFFF